MFEHLKALELNKPTTLSEIADLLPSKLFHYCQGMASDLDDNETFESTAFYLDHPVK